MAHCRGEIYFVKQITPSDGSVQHGDRPAIIVSNDIGNQHSSIVEVVYLTTRFKKRLPTHVVIRATGRTCIALCEQICTVSAEQLDNYCGKCTEQEMRQVDAAIMVSTGLLKANDLRSPAAANPADSSKESLVMQLAVANAKLEMMQQLYDNLLKTVIAGNGKAR